MPDDAIFCEQCGTRLKPDTASIPPAPDTAGIPPAPEPFFDPVTQPAMQQPAGRPPKSRKALYIAVALVVILIAAVGIGLAVRNFSGSSAGAKESGKEEQGKTSGPVPGSSSSSSGSSEDSSSDDSSSADETDNAGSEDTASAQDDSSDTSGPFIIDAGATGDYSQILDPSRYEFYSSGIPEFSFWYPTNFFNDVVFNTSPTAVTYGTNAQQIAFFASDGTQVIYQAARRTDSNTLQEMTNFVYTNEMGLLSSGETIINTTKDNYGKVIVTGWTDSAHSNVVYCLNKIRGDYVLQMKIIFPDYTGEEDRLQKGYVTECFYRMAGFSDADPWRPYSEFLGENS